MASGARLSGRTPALVKAAGVLASAWGAAIFVPALYFKFLLWIAARGGAPFEGPVSAVTRDVLDHTMAMLQLSLWGLAFTVSLGVPMALLVRMIARARIRAGLPDPLDRVRAFSAAHPRAVRALAALPALSMLAFAPELLWWVGHWGGYFQYGHLTGSEIVLHMRSLYVAWMGGFGVAMTAAAGLVYAATRPAVRAFLAPTVDIREAEETATPNSERRIGFDAVAVTAETRAAVALMAALPVLTFLALRAAKLGDTGTEIALALYASVAIGGAVAFRKASRVAIGVDGIFVTGSSRPRFFAFRDVDAVRTNGGEIELVRGRRVVLRLQLHGADATRRGEIVARIDQAIVAAKERRTATIGEVVAAASPEKLTRLADGAEGYRQASVTREQLWSLVASPEPDGSVRTAAARALVANGAESERAKLRVAASQCAQPGLRVALMDVADEELDDEDADAKGGKSRRAAGR